MLEMDSANVAYGDLQVLWDISIKVSKSEIVALVGSNGAGKSTTLMTIAGLLKPTSGSVKFLDSRIDGLPSQRICERGIAYVPEGRRLFPSLTVLENLKMGAYTRRARKGINDSLQQVFELFPILRERKGQLSGKLSGGEQQMLAMARGLMSKPQLLLMDEASLGLAPKVVDQLYEAMKRLNEQGLTIFFVEQNVQLALSVAHRAYVLENGKIALGGSSAELMGDESIKEAYIGLW